MNKRIPARAGLLCMVATYLRNGSFLFFLDRGSTPSYFSFFPICFPFSFRFDFFFSLETALYAGATGDVAISGAFDETWGRTTYHPAG